MKDYIILSFSSIISLEDNVNRKNFGRLSLSRWPGCYTRF